MWTPKRVLILVGTTSLFVAGYLVYAFFLGGIDGLPPLPPDYVRSEDELPLPVQPPDYGETERKLAWAFGAQCEELNRPIKLDLRSKGVVLAAGQMDIEADGRVKLSPFSAALFPKNRVEGKHPEINVVQCEVAFLTLDRAVSSLTELSNRKIVGVELKGNRGVTLVNNRRTPEKNDDIELLITHDSLYFDERRNLVWTDGYVQLLDTQTQPHPTKVTARGMELRLAKDGKDKGAAPVSAATARKGDLSGVELLVLHANVDMHLYVDSRSGFLAGSEEQKSAASVRRPPDRKGTTPAPERSHVVVQTNGPFHYDLTRDLAWFDSPAADSKIPPSSPNNQVLVSRQHKVGGSEKYDQLLCDHLELQFKRKGAGTAADRSTDREIETALATARPGKEVVLTMDTENLEAFGNELHFRCAGPTTGAQTTLKGQPLHAVKDGHKIQAVELHLVGPDRKGNGQQAFAKGPGQIDLYDKANPRNAYPLHAFWKDSLIATKDKDGDRTYDLLTLTGDACFVDEEHKQHLQAQRLQVWLDQPDPSRKADAPKASPAGRQKPHKIDAYERVSATSPDLIVRKTHHLLIRFKDTLAQGDRLPAALPPATGTSPGTNPAILTSNKGPTGKEPSAQEMKKGPTLGSPTLLPTDGPGRGKQRKPIELEAREVVAYISTRGSAKQLDEVVCEGGVKVRQEAADPKDKGVDIDGQMLNLLHHVQGDILYVFGDSRKPAQLQLGELVLIGPKVTINQKDNIAEVEGTGAMHLPSNTTFDGGKPAKPGTRLIVHWNKDMVFNGKYADFHGGIIAYQEGASLKCDTLQVTLDRTVSFREGQKKGPGAKVEKLLCDRKVFIEDRTLDKAGKLQQYDRLVVNQLTMDNLEERVVAAGPGKVHHLAFADAEVGMAPAAGAREPGGAGTGEGAARRKTVVMKLTRVDFEGRMFSTRKGTDRSAKFYDNVEVHHLPADDPDVRVDPDRPGKDGFYLRCDLLSVYTRSVAGKTNQEMEARRNVFFRTEQFFGRADSVKYDQSKEIVVFEGTAADPATLYKLRGQGVPPQEIKGTKILYNRRTGVFQLDGGRVIMSQAAPSHPAANLVALPARRPAVVGRNQS